MKKRKTLLLAILLSLVASVATTSCSPYWYDDGYYYDYPYRGRPGPPPPPPPHRPHHNPHHGHGW
ncbi:MAG: hypothetical protein II691_04215 [Muribaculaceae bacterium]|nr:hypothetical protein [Muribaculaceae bacterium]MBQ6647759.1 hypothetical protein [Muribaculaceae bacterium]